MNSVTNLRLSVLLAALASAGVACSTDSDSPNDQERRQEPAPDAGDPRSEGGTPAPSFPRAYVGEVEGTDARVGIFGRDPNSFRLYSCGGPETVGLLTHWFNTTTGFPDDGYTYTLQVEEDVAVGTVYLPDATGYSFTARPVTWGKLPGLYEATAPCGKVGVIISEVPDSDEFHVQGACAGPVIADAKQVNPILPLTRASDGSIEVQVEGDTDVVVVKPATL